MNNIMMSKKQMTAAVVKQYAHIIHMAACDGDYGECLRDIENLRNYVYRAGEDKRMHELALNLHEHAINGQVPILVYQQDCDLCETTNLTWVPALTEEYDRLASDLSHNAEGPWQLTMLTEKEVKRFTPSVRDRAAEQAGY